MRHFPVEEIFHCKWDSNHKLSRSVKFSRDLWSQAKKFPGREIMRHYTAEPQRTAQIAAARKVMLRRKRALRKLAK